ncbi:hypothetical protein B5S31_g154 [[Candida] boidinii]|nr:hypothetical protein B5S31_g154 [[Candida] boidinii]GME68822.1 unnamed protein product [[Candida] boidinii]
MSNNCYNEHIASGGNGDDGNGHSHSHSHTHGGGSHNHDHAPPPIPTNPSQSLNSKIATTRLTALNLTNPQNELPKLFKSFDDKYSIKPEFKSDADNQLIIRIPFNGVTVKLYSIILRTNSNSDNCPRVIKLYKNNDHLDFDSTDSTKHTYEIEHSEIGFAGSSNSDDDVFVNDDEFVEHFLPRHLFSNVTDLSIFFQNNWTDDDDENLIIYSLELRGEFKELTKDPIITMYESAANPADHKNILKDSFKNNLSID